MANFLEQLLGLGQGDPLQQASRNNWDMLGSYDTRANLAVDRGVTEGNGILEQMRGLYQPLSGATNLYADAIGLNGAEGGARANGAYQESPGFQHSLGTGLQALDRRRAAAGSFQSGGADIDTMDYATGLASRDHGSWLDRLMGASGTALSGQASALGGMANLNANATNRRGDIIDGLTSGYLSANNQAATGEQQNMQGVAGLGSNLFSLAGRFAGGGGFGGF